MYPAVVARSTLGPVYAVAVDMISASAEDAKAPQASGRSDAKCPATRRSLG